MEMKIHFGFILFLISSSLFVTSDAEGGNRQIEETEKRGISVEVETLNVQLEILSLLKQIKKQNNEVIKEISNGQKENTKVIKEISLGLKENTKQAEENSKVMKFFISEIKDNTNEIKENTDETKQITINIKDIINKIGENNEKEKEIIRKIKETTNNIKQDTSGIKEIINGVTNSTNYLQEIKLYLTPARNCDDLRLKGDKNSGIRTVYPYPSSPRKSFEVLCDQQTEGGGWTVFQARENLPKRENFQRNWKDYSHGFGNLNDEFWMGLELLNVMSKLDVMELRVDLEDDTGEKRFAKYDSFSVEDEDQKFKLKIGSYGGTAGNSLSWHNLEPFSTMDQDNDRSIWDSAAVNKGGWWYRGRQYSNLNGLPHVGEFSSSSNDGIIWWDFRGYNNSMAKTKMMFRLSRKNNSLKLN